jgi:ribonuclease HII
MALAESIEAVESVPKVAVRPPNFRRERKLFREGYLRVAGVDEAGRGPLAGPVVAAAVILNPKRIPKGLADSKVMTALQREAAFAAIMKTADVAFAFGSVGAIDRINILRASLLAMSRAIKALSAPPDAILVDGRDLPPGVSMKAQAIIDGDALSLSIAAASIVAKVMRDRLMTRCDPSFSGYGLEGTPRSAGRSRALPSASAELLARGGLLRRADRLAAGRERLTSAGASERSAVSSGSS